MTTELDSAPALSVGINHQQVWETVANRLRDEILSGALPEGRQLVEIDLANRFGVSRGTIQRALRETTRMGLTTDLPRRGTFVAPVEVSHLEEVMTVRKAIEEAAGRLAIRRARERIVAKMQDLLQTGPGFNIFCASGGTGAVRGLDALLGAGRARAVNGEAQDLWALSIDGTTGELNYLSDPDVALMDTIVRLPKSTAKLHWELLKKIFSGEIDPDSDFQQRAPSVLLHKKVAVERIRAMLAEYSVLPDRAAHQRTDAASGSDGRGSVTAAKKIVFINYGNVSEYMAALSEQFKKIAEAEGAQVTLVDGKFDPATQVKAMDEAIAAGADAIVVIPFSTKALVESTRAARAKGILVEFGAFIPNPAATVPALTYNDTEAVHKAVADAVAWLKGKHPGDRAKVVLFDEPNTVSHEWRMQAFEDEIKKVMGPGNVDIVFHDYVDASAEDEDNGRLRELLSAYERVAHAGQQLEAQSRAIDFHRAVVALAGSPRLLAIFDEFAAQTLTLLRVAHMRSPSIPWTQPESVHRDIYRAIVARDEGALAAALAAHFEYRADWMPPA